MAILILVIPVLSVQKNLIPLIAPIGETRGTDLAFSSSNENEKGELTG